MLHKSTTLRGMCIYFFLINSYIFELPLFCSFLFTKEEFEDTKGVIRIRISQEVQNGQKKKYKRTNNDLQNIHIKLKIA